MLREVLDAEIVRLGVERGAGCWEGRWVLRELVGFERVGC